MTIDTLEQMLPDWEERLVIGRDVQTEGRFCHIVGMTRRGEEAVLYILEQETLPEFDQEAWERNKATNRSQLKQPNRQPMFLKGIQVGEQKLTVRSATSGVLAINPTIEGGLEALLLLYEMERAGWRLPEGHPFGGEDWSRLLLTRLEIPLDSETAAGGLPDWEKNKAVLQFDQSWPSFLIEQTVCLDIGKERELPFTLEDGRKGACYINKVYLMDVWAEQEKRFADPRYQERFPAEELEEIKQQFFEVLAEGCPRGMCYLGIEYECSLEGSLVFYETAFLNREPEEHHGSARMLMMALHPDEERGTHGKKLYGCVVQAPLPPDTKQVEVELFKFLERQAAWELVL